MAGIYHITFVLTKRWNVSVPSKRTFALHYGEEHGFSGSHGSVSVFGLDLICFGSEFPINGYTLSAVWGPRVVLIVCNFFFLLLSSVYCMDILKIRNFNVWPLSPLNKAVNKYFLCRYFY